LAAWLWLTCPMRVQSRGNLTVELIRLQRFDISYFRPAEHHVLANHTPPHCCDHDPAWHRCDRVHLSEHALAYDPWQGYAELSAPPCSEADACSATDESTCPAYPPEPEPREITPIIGSPALSGLGVALVVPGSLLDVLA